MFTAYNNNVCVRINPHPHIDIQYIDPEMNEGLKILVKNKPFKNMTSLDVILTDFKKDVVYSFTIPQGYTWDGATIPRFFWGFIGSPYNPSFLIASLIHDVLCENHYYVDNDRYFADKVFDCLLEAAGVNSFKRWLMFHSVDNYQKFCKW